MAVGRNIDVAVAFAAKYLHATYAVLMLGVPVIFAPLPCSVAPLPALCCPQLVHLLHTLLELFVLALFVRVSLVL